MKVTDLNYNLENKLVERLDAFAEMVTRPKQIQDVVISIHGKTGSGKTNSSVIIAYYLSYVTKREIHLFFKSESAMDFMKKNTDCIVIVDEPSLDTLSTDQVTKKGKNFIRLINTMRQKRNILILNITRFWRFPFDVVVDRSLAMINMYNKDGKDPGRFHYIRHKRLEQLWIEYFKTRKKLFGKLKSFGGRMPEFMEKLDENNQPFFNKLKITVEGHKNATYDDYRRLKDLAIGSINEDEVKTKKELQIERRYNELKGKVSNLVYYLSTKKILDLDTSANLMGITSTRFREWRKMAQIDQNPLGKQVLETPTATSIVITMAEEQQIGVPTHLEEEGDQDD